MPSPLLPVPQKQPQEEMGLLLCPLGLRCHFLGWAGEGSPFLKGGVPGSCSSLEKLCENTLG